MKNEILFFHFPAAILKSVKIKNERTLLQFCIYFSMTTLDSLLHSQKAQYVCKWDIF